MCNRSGGLIQRVLESEGIATTGISIVRRFTEEVRPPRSVFVKWPYGHPLGEPFNKKQQMAVLEEALALFESAEKPGEIVDLPFKWRRHNYD